MQEGLVSEREAKASDYLSWHVKVTWDVHFRGVSIGWAGMKLMQHGCVGWAYVTFQTSSLTPNMVFKWDY